MTTFMTRLAWAGAICLASLSAANAHMTLETGEAPAGGSYKAVIRVPHGCDGAMAFLACVFFALLSRPSEGLPKYRARRAPHI